jgi:hypothetical protein
VIAALMPSALRSVPSLFCAPYMEFALIALAEGNSYARLWGDTPSNPTSAFLWEGPRFYLTGHTDNAAFNEAVREMIATQIQPALGSYLVIYYDAPRWVEQLPRIFGHRPLHDGQRCFYRLDAQGIPDWRERVPESFSIVPIDR